AAKLIKRLQDHATLIRKMDAIANEHRPTQTSEASAILLETAAAAIAVLTAAGDYADSAGAAKLIKRLQDHATMMEYTSLPLSGRGPRMISYLIWRFRAWRNGCYLPCACRTRGWKGPCNP